MARGIRFTKLETQAIREDFDLRMRNSLPGNTEKQRAKALEIRTSVLAKLNASEAPQVKSSLSYLSTADALNIFREVLGPRLLCPPNNASLVFIKMQHRLKSLALTRDQCFAIAEQAKREWTRGNIKAESILNQAEMLLQNSALHSDEPVSLSIEDDTSDVMSEL